MNREISKEEAIEKLSMSPAYRHAQITGQWGDLELSIHMAIEVFEKVERLQEELGAAHDVIKKLSQESPKGRWEHLGGDEWCCTNCGHVISTEGNWEKPAAKFCEDCGADMRGEQE